MEGHMADANAQSDRTLEHGILQKPLTAARIAGLKREYSPDVAMKIIDIVSKLDLHKNEAFFESAWRDYLSGAAESINPLPLDTATFEESDIKALQSDWLSVMSDIDIAWNTAQALLAGSISDARSRGERPNQSEPDAAEHAELEPVGRDTPAGT